MRARDDRGTSLIEVAVGIFVLAIAITGVIGSMGSGMNLVGHSRKRTAGTGVALEKIERIYATPYDRLALIQYPTHSTDPKNPDYDVTTDNTRFSHGGGPPEPLHVDPANGEIPHFEDPVTVGKTDFNIYQYVTWVDDPQLTGEQDYKRVVVIVTWKHPLQTSVVNRVVESTYVGKGTITVPTTSPSAPPSTSPSAPPPPPFPTADPTACAGDETGPVGTIEIASGTGAQAGYTSSPSIVVTLNATDDCTEPPMVASLSDDGTAFTEVTTLTNGVTEEVHWTVPTGEGLKSIAVRFRDGRGNLSSISTAAIVLDQTIPTVPAGLTKATPCTMSDPIRTVTMTWTSSSDTNLIGYRVERDNGSGWVEAVTTSGLSASDTHPVALNTKFRVTAYDRAGNRSGDSNEILYQKNKCT